MPFGAVAGGAGEKSSLPGRYSEREDIAIGRAVVSRDNLIDLLSGGRCMTGLPFKKNAGGLSAPSICPIAEGVIKYPRALGARNKYRCLGARKARLDPPS